jgi:ATP/maltotriose-dependent transcriptional regulator MalT
MRRGYLMVVRGDQAAAEEELRAAERTLLAARQPASAATAAGWLALSAIRRGEPDEAEALLAEYLDPIREYGIRGYFLRSFRAAQAELWLLRTEKAGETARATALREAKAACRGLRKLAKADISALVPAYRVRGTCEWLCGRHDKAESWWRKSLARAEELGALYEGALTELEVGRRLGDRAALTEAETAFETMGAALDLMQARAALAETHGLAQQAVSV